MLLNITPPFERPTPQFNPPKFHHPRRPATISGTFSITPTVKTANRTANRAQTGTDSAFRNPTQVRDCLRPQNNHRRRPARKSRLGRPRHGKIKEEESHGAKIELNWISQSVKSISALIWGEMWETGQLLARRLPPGSKTKALAWNIRKVRKMEPLVSWCGLLLTPSLILLKKRTITIQPDSCAIMLPFLGLRALICQSSSSGTCFPIFPTQTNAIIMSRFLAQLNSNHGTPRRCQRGETGKTIN